MTNKDDVRFWGLFFVQLVVAVCALIAILQWPARWNAVRILGFVLLMAGLALVFTARLQLGSSFSITPQARRLVTYGLYAKIRNPIYVFGGVAIFGVCLIMQRSAAWIVFAASAVLQIFRARREATVLEAKFGEEYRSYCRQTWF